MRNLKLILMLFVSFIVATTACKKDSTIDPIDDSSPSFTMTYDGITYTEADPSSLILGLGMISAKGTTGDGYILTIIGIGADGTTTAICPDPESCNNICTLMLDFGAVVGKEGFVATSGTIKRTGKKLEISASGIGTTNFTNKTMTATIVVKTVVGK